MSAALGTPPPHGDEPEEKLWETFLRRYATDTISHAIAQGERSVKFSWFDVTKLEGGQRLADNLLVSPIETLAKVDAALARLDLPVLHGSPRPRLRARPTLLPESERYMVASVRSELLGRLISVRGMVKKRSTALSWFHVAAWQCKRCGNVLLEKNPDPRELKKPIECHEDQGGCGRDSSFELIPGGTKDRRSKGIDYQEAEVQELPEHAEGDQPRRVNVLLKEDLVDDVRVGQRVTLNAVLNARTRGKSAIAEYLLEVVSVEHDEHDEEDAQLSPDEEQAIRLAAARPDALEALAACLAPHIHGAQLEKESIILQLFGGVRTQAAPGTYLRGDVHVLLAGDPSTGKTQLMKAAAALAPRAVVTTGMSTSGAGLTAAAVQDTGAGGEGRWVLEAGAAVFADRGLLVVDELDKMPADDASHMLAVMEDQRFVVAKAAHGEFVTRCSVLGGMNPKDSRFTSHAPKLQQIDLDDALRTRFDLIWIMTDDVNPERDALIARKILETRRGTHDDAPILPFERDFIKKWVRYARHACHPRMGDDVVQHLERFFLEARAWKKTSEDPTPIAPRQLEALTRLAQASARLHLRDVVTIEDAKRATRLVMTSLSRYALNDGKWDIDNLEAKRTHDQRERAQLLAQIVRDHANATPHGAPEDLVVSEAERRGIPQADARALLKSMAERANAPIWSERDGFYKVHRR